MIKNDCSVKVLLLLLPLFLYLFSFTTFTLIRLVPSRGIERFENDTSLYRKPTTQMFYKRLKSPLVFIYPIMYKTFIRSRKWFWRLIMIVLTATVIKSLWHMQLFSTFNSNQYFWVAVNSKIGYRVRIKLTYFCIPPFKNNNNTYFTVSFVEIRPIHDLASSRRLEFVIPVTSTLNLFKMLLMLLGLLFSQNFPEMPVSRISECFNG